MKIKIEEAVRKDAKHEIEERFAEILKCKRSEREIIRSIIQFIKGRMVYRLSDWAYVVDDNGDRLDECEGVSLEIIARSIIYNSGYLFLYDMRKEYDLKAFLLYVKLYFSQFDIDVNLDIPSDTW